MRSARLGRGRGRRSCRRSGELAIPGHLILLDLLGLAGCGPDPRPPRTRRVRKSGRGRTAPARDRPSLFRCPSASWRLHSTWSLALQLRLPRGIHQAEVETVDPAVVTGPAGPAKRWSFASASGAEQRQLGCPRHALDACLLAASSRAVGHRHRKLELDRQPAGRIAARDAGSVALKPALEIDRPARVERAVAAAQHINPGLGHRATASPRRRQALRIRVRATVLVVVTHPLPFASRCAPSGETDSQVVGRMSDVDVVGVPLDERCGRGAIAGRDDRVRSEAVATPATSSTPPPVGEQ